MNKVFNKLKEARVLLGLSQQEMADAADVSQRDISQLEGGKKEFIPTEIIQYLNYRGVDINSLYDDSKNIQLKKQKGDKNPHLKPHPNTHLKEDINSNEVAEERVKYGKKGNSGIPLVSIEALAGLANSHFTIEQKDIKEYYIVPDFQNIQFMLRVTGNSMYPKYNSGDVVACRILKDRAFIQWNKVHVIATKEQGILIKRLRKSTDENHYTAISDNKDYDAFDIPIREINSIAIVVGVIRLE